MAKFERLEPRTDDMPVFDGSVDEDEESEEGSRLPLLIVIALLVLAAFAGVVYLAYTQGVARGRADAPRVVVAQASGSKLKVYQQAAPPDEDATEADSVPPPPTPAPAPAPNAAPAVSATAQPSAAPAAPLRQTTAASSPATRPTKSSTSETKTARAMDADSVPSQSKPAAAPAAPTDARVATHAPAALVPPASTTAAESPPVAATGAPTEPQAAPESRVASAPPASKGGAADTQAKPAARAGVLLQIGAYKSQDEAQTAWQEFQTRHALAGGYTSNIKKVNLGDKGTWYRLRIGPFADRDDANALCAKLKADGAACLLAR